MSSTKREREYARRRFNDWQQRQAAKAARARRVRIVVLSLLGALVAIAVVVFLVLAFKPDDSTSIEAAASDTPSASTSAAANPCPAPSGVSSAAKTAGSAAPATAQAQGKSWKVTLQTSCGPIALSLDGAKAPQSVANFLSLAKKGFFDNTSCHRLTTTGIYVLQCGDPTATGTGGPGYSWGPVENAPTDDVYPAGTLAMARQGNNAKSQGSQFFIVYKDSTIPSDSAGGYSVFGKVSSGLDVVQKVADGGSDSAEKPNRPIAIESAEIQ